MIDIWIGDKIEQFCAPLGYWRPYAEVNTKAFAKAALHFFRVKHNEGQRQFRLIRGGSVIFQSGDRNKITWEA